ncbi:MAG: hypothetical protein GWO08_06400, partial [Gammaproteobacteria bacterium]|nr:hypothetical protein [Gammaproteobacteria bacterium]NIR93305.1 hypothetical protein [Gammaproteobacteria bacterium]NIW99822.1 hypothetical protein [Phycisphaerae bacterium]
MSYDNLGNVKTRTEGALRVEDAFIGAIDATESRISTYIYDAAGRQVKTLHPSEYFYDAQLDALNNYQGRNESRQIPTE